MTEKFGIHIRIVENGYVAHEYTSDKDWAFRDVKELVDWLVPELLSKLPKVGGSP